MQIITYMNPTKILSQSFDLLICRSLTASIFIDRLLHTGQGKNVNNAQSKHTSVETTAF